MSGSTDVTRKRKQVKLKCLVCGRAFDDDHRKDHNERFHPEYKRENRLVPFQTLGAAKNPFEAAKRKERERGIFNGAQQKLREKLNQRVPYVPCRGHR